MPNPRMDIPNSQRATEIGCAAEHLVVADLLLKGYRAFLAGAQLPYDVIMDRDGLLMKIAVKSAGNTRIRRCRAENPENVEEGRPIYMFRPTRSVQYSSGRRATNRYDPKDVDVFALVALDIRVVAYLPCLLTTPATLEFSPPGEYRPSSHRYGPKSPRPGQKKIDQFPIESVIGEPAHG